MQLFREIQNARLDQYRKQNQFHILYLSKFRACVNYCYSKILRQRFNIQSCNAYRIYCYSHWKEIVKTVIKSLENEWTHGFGCPSIMGGGLILKIWGQIFSYIFGGINLDGEELKLYARVIFITTLSWYHFFRNSQHPDKWGVSFKNFFRKSVYIRSCYLLIASNLLKMTFRKTSLFVLPVTGVMLAAYFKLLLLQLWLKSMKNIGGEVQF